MRISLDLDGVLSCFENSAASVANSIWPGKIPDGYRPTNWDWPDVLNETEWDAVWTKIKTIPDFWQTAPAYENSVQELNNFLEQNPETRVFFITARITTGGVSARKQTEKWLEQFGLWPRGNLSTVLVTRPEKKVELMAEAQIQFSVDDKWETVESCNRLAGHQAYLFDQPWNQGVDLPRVYSTKEYLEIVSSVRV